MAKPPVKICAGEKLGPCGGIYSGKPCAYCKKPKGGDDIARKYHAACLPAVKADAESKPRKTCIACRKSKSRESYANDPSRFDGKFPYCKACANAKYEKYRRAKNPPPLCKVCGGYVVPKNMFGVCKGTAECKREYARLRKEHVHSTGTLKRYGITGEEYWAIYRAQGGTCAICQRAKGITKRLAVDHDHAIEADKDLRSSVRGLLCGPCNHMLGSARDQIDFFRRAIAYLDDPPARKVLHGLEG